MYSFLADVTVFVHLVFLAFVLLGQLAVVAAGTFKWEWGRNPWFRLTHLGAILFVAIETVIGYECPLTTWERDLRVAAGEVVDERWFVVRLIHDIVFLGNRYENPESIAVGFIAFFLMVVQGFLMFPPRFRRAKLADVPEAAARPESRPGPLPQTVPQPVG